MSGKDLIADGMTPGPDIGRVLEHLLELVLDYPEKNEHDVLIKESRRYRAGEEQAGEVEPSRSKSKCAARSCTAGMLHDQKNT